MNIIKPSPAEKEKAIEYILAQGLVKPKSLWQYLEELYRALGFRYLFVNTVQPVLISVALMTGFILLYPWPTEQYKNALLFATAPLFFIFAVVLTETVERSSPLYDLKMTCKYTIQQITAFRVFVFFLLGMVFCTLLSLFAGISEVADFFRAFSLSLCALFFCSLLSIFFLRRFPWRWIHLLPGMLWLVLGFSPLWLLQERWELFLSQVPVALTTTFAAIALGLYIKELKMLMDISRRGVVSYVGC